MNPEYCVDLEVMADFMADYFEADRQDNEETE